MSKNFNKISRNLFFYVLPISFIIVLVVSYFAFRKLILPGDLVLPNGKKYSQIAPAIRNDFLKRNGVRAVNFKTRDGLKIAGLLVKRSNPVGNLLLCHGYQSCKERVVDLVDMFPDYNVLLFDFRAHGQSGGRFRTLGCHEYKDVIAAAEFLSISTKKNKSLPNTLPLVILGFSMGGSSALRAVKYEPNICDVLILDSSFSNLKTVIYNAFNTKSNLPSYPFLPVLEKMFDYIAGCDLNKMRPIDSLKKFDKPILFIHSCVDKIVQPADSLLMYANSLNEKTKIWIGPKCDHPKLYKKHSQLYKKKVYKFLKKALT